VETTAESEPKELGKLRSEYSSRIDKAAASIELEYDRKMTLAREPIDKWYKGELEKLLKSVITNDVQMAMPVQNEIELLRTGRWENIEFRAIEAQFTGYLRRNRQIDALDFWTDEKISVSWSDQKVLPGVYEVYATYACPPDNGGVFKISIGGQNLNGDVQPTGGWDFFETFRVGQVTINARRIDIEVSGKSFKGFALWNLRGLTLKRTK
jgi:hypothetical protein